LKYAHLGQFGTTDSFDKLKYYDEWWSLPPVHKNTERGILHSGVFYCYGKDENHAPNIYFHPARIDLKNVNLG